MRKVIVPLIFFIMLNFAACKNNNSEEIKTTANILENDTTTSGIYSNIERTLPEPKYSGTKIKFSWDEKEIIVCLIDNEAAENLTAMLPMSLTFEDYRGRQKTGVITGGLDIGNSPSECDCFVGDMNYYEPWDMLTFFYKDFGYAPDLTPLGKIESGTEYLEEIDLGSIVTVDLLQ